MAELKIKKSAGFFVNCLTLVLTLIGTVFFALSYGTGYIGIVYGEKNSVWITLELAAVILICLVLTGIQAAGKQKPELFDVLTYLLVLLLTTATLFLLVDRVDAIGNCIVAPWDAGHGGEDSCYLSFVSMGCWLIALVANIVLSFAGYRKKDN